MTQSGVPGPVSRTSLRVRYGETDQMGVVYHGHYFAYFEQGRTEYLRERGMTYRELEEQGTFLAVVECACRYRANASYDEALTVETVLSAASRVKIRFDYRVLRSADGVLLAEGHTVLACLDRQKKPRAIPEALAERLPAAAALGPIPRAES